MPSLKVSSLTLSYGAFPPVTNIRSSVFHLQQAKFQDPPPNLRSSVIHAQDAEFQLRLPEFRCPIIITQYAIRTVEPTMSTEIFPALPGLSWEIHMKPSFSTKVAVHTSGKETRTMFWDDPVWDFDLIYDYLPNKKEVGVTDLEKIVGFFLDRKGSFDNFLFTMPDCNSVSDILLLTGDGNTVEAPLVTLFNHARTPIGQIEPTTAQFFIELTETKNVNAEAITLAYPHDAAIASVVSGDGITMVKVDAAPTANQYTFNAGTATLGFNVARDGQAMTIHYQSDLLTPAEYSISMPNTLVLAVAPPAGAVVTGTYSFYFTVRFMDDQADFDQFMDRLWELQAISLRSTL
jgi:hypothetical protein